MGALLGSLAMAQDTISFARGAPSADILPREAVRDAAAVALAEDWEKALSYGTGIGCSVPGPPVRGCRCSCSTTSAGRSGGATATTTPSGSPTSTAGRSPTTPSSSRASPGSATAASTTSARRPRRAGPRNGVLTAVEDFLAANAQSCGSAIVAPFFGLGGGLAPAGALGPALETAIAPWDRNPVLERVEAKRIDHLVAEFRTCSASTALRSADYVLPLRGDRPLLPIHAPAPSLSPRRLSAVTPAGPPERLARRPRRPDRRARRRRDRRRATCAGIPSDSPDGEPPMRPSSREPTSPPATLPAVGPDLASDGFRLIRAAEGRRTG